MVTDLQLAKLSHDAYNIATHVKRNRAVLIAEGESEAVVAFRGTNGPIDMIANLLAIPWKPKEIDAWGHCGFWLYACPLFDYIIKTLRQIGKPAVLTGHSLGGSSANFFGAACLKYYKYPVERLTTFGAPRSGYDSLSNITSKIPGRRYVIEGDQVTILPPSWFVFPYVHDRPETLLPGIPGPIDHRMTGYIAALEAIEQRRIATDMTTEFNNLID